MRKVFAINLLVLCVFVLLVEILGQLYYRWSTGATVYEHATQYARDAQASTTIFEQHPYLVARPKAEVRMTRAGGTISTTAAHTRVTGPTRPRPDAIKIAVVGGSTTFGTKVLDADSWPWLLQEALGDGYLVLNYGVPGYTTAENIIQMALLVPEQQPAIVIFYEGWNDIRNYHWPGFTADYYGHGMTQFDTLIPPQADTSSFLTRAARYSFVIGLVNRALGTPVGAAEAPPSGARDPEVDRIYLRNLTTLKLLADHFGMKALFVPQVLNYENFTAKGESRSWTPYIEDAAMSTLMRGFNSLMSSVCAPTERRCEYVDEALTTAWNGNDFVDEGHLSRQGGEKLAAILATRIKRPTP